MTLNRDTNWCWPTKVVIVFLTLSLFLSLTSLLYFFFSLGEDEEKGSARVGKSLTRQQNCPPRSCCYCRCWRNCCCWHAVTAGNAATAAQEEKRASSVGESKKLSALSTKEWRKRPLLDCPSFYVVAPLYLTKSRKLQKSRRLLQNQ